MAKPVSAAERVVLHPAELGGAGVEIFVSTPARPNPCPIILFVHGHQEPARPGGLDYATVGRLDRMAARGFIAASVSQPGYGASDGPPDFCGLRTQAAIRGALAHLRSLPEADAGQTILYGVSRGAIANAMVAANEPELKGLILVGGTYDLAAAYRHLPSGVRRNLDVEAGTAPMAYVDRSALPIADRIQAHTLILHGRYDDGGPIEQAEALRDVLERRGTPVRLRIFETGHMIPLPDQWHEIDPFLAEVLR